MSGVFSSGRKAGASAQRVPPFVSSVGNSGFKTQHELAEAIRQAWAAVGYEIQVWIEVDGELRSDLINALPMARMLPFSGRDR